MKPSSRGRCDAGAVHTQVAHAFDEAARWFLEISAHAVGRYDEPALGEWSVRDLLGHASRSLSTVETYLDVALTDSGPVELADAVAYYHAIADALADSAATVERGRAAGAVLGEDSIRALGALVVRVPERVRAAPAGAMVRTPFGMMTLEGYLPTRTLELTVHTCDLAAALGRQRRRPPSGGSRYIRCRRWSGRGTRQSIRSATRLDRPPCPASRLLGLLTHLHATRAERVRLTIDH
ncbi:MAG: maleylpyruvate isomerase N-terminal domain-containing protein [Candidatus Dormibacteria bacterium]